jgi:DNA-binding transcriptional ArsR family regulator
MSLSYAAVMYSELDIAQVAGLLADRTRVDLVVALAGDVARPASELAGLAGVSPAVASAHLGRLLDAGILAVEKQGRHRYYRLARPEIIEALEPLARLAPPARVRSLREHRRVGELREGRRCYDHLAGRIGVALTDAMRANAWIEVREDAWTLTVAGAEAVTGLGVDLERTRRRRRALLRPCVDWSERRHHLAGALAAALLTAFVERDWLRPHPATRAVSLTPHGATGLAAYLGVESIG